ncbi:MAG: cysteine--tRNA ligase [Candidatus Spechtbacterales bacterium]|nr:cysteine--tRNA ligase [Candidatus Spechtbacterales bacterium]
MKIYNTLTKDKDELKARDGKLRIFVCGPTVYDYSHIGHARTYIAFDMFVKYMRLKHGMNVFYLQNITDIDDKIINRSWEEKRTAEEVAKEYTKKYFEDMDSLGVDSVDKYAPASKYIKEIIDQVQHLIDNDYAYPTDNGVYFRVKKFEGYGKLSGQKLDEMHEAVNIDEDTTKEDPKDFALWKKAKENEPQWDSPWGPGRPGWHIEDTAIAEKELGAQYELHGGARDLIFPHHEAEIAQMEAAYNVEPMVEYWMHTGFLQVGGEKMSKSLKNFTTIRDALKVVSPQALRIFFTTKHYRSPIDYTEEGLEESKKNEKRLIEFWINLQEKDVDDDIKSSKEIKTHLDDFWNFLEDDFNTPRAFAELFQLISYVNKQDKLSPDDKNAVLSFLEKLNNIFSVINKRNLKFEIPKEIKDLAEKREKARKNKQWEDADKFREEIEKKGYTIRDTDNGSEIRKK